MSRQSPSVAEVNKAIAHLGVEAFRYSDGYVAIYTVEPLPYRSRSVYVYSTYRLPLDRWVAEAQSLIEEMEDS